MRILPAALCTMLLGACGVDDQFVDFATFNPPDRQNHFLVCPPGHCSGKTDAASPTFALPPDRLAQIVRKTLAAQPRTTLMREDAGRMQFVFVQTTPVMHWPDTIAVQVLPAGKSQSTLAIYSHSNYGRRDFGVNRARVEAWLQAIGAGAGA